jgi:SAM-dependent methyltransferase
MATSSPKSDPEAHAALSPAVIFVLAWLRLVGRSIDGLALSRWPRLFGLWWRGLWRPPSPWRGGFGAVIAANKAGVPVDDLVYGEAFVVAARRLLASIGVGPESVVVDLGCGRGGVLVAAASLGAVARGVDVLPAHVEAIGAAAQRAGVEVECGDARTIAERTLDDASVVWLSWVTWSATTRAAVTARLRRLRSGALVVGITHGVDDDDVFDVVVRRRLWCTWGRADVVVCRRRPH